MGQAPTASAPPPVVVIEPENRWSFAHLRELWEFRQLLYYLAWRDIKVRYKQTALGVAWALLQPLGTVAVLTVVFGRLSRIDSEGLPYPVFCYAAVLPWIFFAQGFAQASNSLVTSSNLLTKVYFPRIFIPVAPLFAAAFDSLLGFVVLSVLMVWYGTGFGQAVLLLPAFALLALGITLGMGLWVSAITVRYRDVRHAMSFVIQLWFFSTPVVYPSHLIIDTLTEEHLPIWIIGLNPMFSVVQGFRWSLLGADEPPRAAIAASVLVVAAVVVTGAAYFRRMEASFADVV